jgi:hypothetical protein
MQGRISMKKVELEYVKSHEAASMLGIAGYPKEGGK